MVPQWHRSKQTGTFRSYIQNKLNSLKQNSNWNDFDFSYEHVEKLSQEWWEKDFNPDDKDFYADKTDPIPWKENLGQRNRTNLIATACTRYRDEKVIEAVHENLKNHDRILVVYGASHAVMQEPAIRKLLENES